MNIPKKVTKPLALGLAFLFLAAGVSSAMSGTALAANAHAQCSAGNHRAGNKCVKTDKNHPVDKADLNCAGNQTPAKITGGQNQGKWYCKAGGGGNGGNNGGNGGNGGNAGGSCDGSSCDATPTSGGNNCDSSNCDLIALYVNPFIRILSIIVGLVVAGSLIMGGIQYSSSTGDPQKTGAAKSRISNTLLAFFAYALLYAFLNFLIPGGIFH